MEPQIFQYTDPVEFLNAWFKHSQERNPQFSMRSWAKQLDLNHVAMLSMVLSRKRTLLPTLSSKISTQFRKAERLQENEARYFDILVLYSNAKNLEEKNFYEGILSTLRPDKTFSTLSLDQLNVIAEWYHSAILEMTYLKDFNSDPRWISLKLGESVNETQVKTALERLVRLGLLERNSKGKLCRTSAQLATPTDIPNKSLRKYHTEMIQKAAHALESQSVDQRDITSTTFSIDSKKLPEAKRMIRKFRAQLNRFLESTEGDAVYQLNIQLFDLLNKSGEKL